MRDEATLESTRTTAVADRGGGDLTVAHPQEPLCPTTPRLADLDTAQPFADRHIGPGADERATMLEPRSASTSLDALMDAAVPGGIRAADALGLPAAATEQQAARELREIAGRNTPREPMIGLGYHGTITPPVVRRNVLEDPSWYTAYTPYQPEISPGPARGADQLPDHGRRPDRPADRQRVAARRGAPPPPRR